MATTILLKQKVGVITTKKGENIYLLCEQTYQSNEVPRFVSWRAIAFGNYQHVLREVFNCSAFCESGMIKSKNASILAEDYIESWLEKMKTPLELNNKVEFNLNVGPSFRHAIPESHWDKVKSHLVNNGFHNAVENIESLSDGLQVTLEKDLDLITEIYAGDNQLPCWRLFHDQKIFGKKSRKLNPPLSNHRGQITPIQDFKYTADTEGNLFWCRKNEPWKATYRGAYIPLTEVILNDAFLAESTSYGEGIELIRHHRYSIQHPVALPTDTAATVKMKHQNAPGWAIDAVNQLAQSLGIEQSAESFTLNFHRLSARQRRDLMDLPSSLLTWCVPLQ